MSVRLCDVTSNKEIDLDSEYGQQILKESIDLLNARLQK